jgi:hypothetical protein
LPPKTEFHDKIDEEIRPSFLERLMDKFQDITEYITSAAYSNRESKPGYMKSDTVGDTNTIQGGMQGSSQTYIQSTNDSEIPSSQETTHSIPTATNTIQSNNQVDSQEVSNKFCMTEKDVTSVY